MLSDLLALAKLRCSAGSSPSSEDFAAIAMLSLSCRGLRSGSHAPPLKISENDRAFRGKTF